MISAKEALERLREGNRRFVADVRSRDTLMSQTRRNELALRQEPFAIILGCSDSRVPAEIVFDQGLGDLFVIRVAGNIVAPSQVGSVEFAAARFETRLVVVLGHSQCGAILATLEELQQPTENQSRNLRSIVDRVRPSVEGLLETDLRHDPDALVRRRRARQHPRVRGPSAPRLGDPRAADPERTGSSSSAPSTRSRPGSSSSSTRSRAPTEAQAAATRKPMHRNTLTALDCNYLDANRIFVASSERGEYRERRDVALCCCGLPAEPLNWGFVKPPYADVGATADAVRSYFAERRLPFNLTLRDENPRPVLERLESKGWRRKSDPTPGMTLAMPKAIPAAPQRLSHRGNAHARAAGGVS